ncbi:MAG: GAF domain-containing protein [Anaerolineae bacterium]|nr:GAF domain-containing protein [Anaerolineae bacterium]
MPQLLNWLFVVRHDYRTPLNTMRARIILPFSSGAGLLLLIMNILFLVGLVSQRTERMKAYVLIMFPIAWIIAFVTSYLIQNGHLFVGMLNLGVLLAAYTVSDVLLAGTMTTGIIFPMLIIYASLAFGRRGAIFAYSYVLAALVVMLLIRAEGRLGTEPIDELSTIVFFSGSNITITSLMLWLFAGSLETTLSQVHRVISQTRATSMTGQTISRILNLDELLTETVDLIRERFAFYHVQIFIVDEAHGYANLAASTGEQGRTLLSQGFQVAIGPRTVVGESISAEDMRYVPDITKTAYRHPDVLANTRAVLVLPLVVGDEVIGALDVQSTRPNAFTEEDIETLSVMANQVSQAIHNARLFESQQRNLLQNRRLFLESETNLREIERLNRQLTGESWQEYVNERGHEQFGVKITGDNIERGALAWTPAMLQAAERRRVVTQKNDDEQVMALPITIRGEPVGAIEVQLADTHNPTEVRNLLQAVTERLAFSLENARLFEQAQLAAERELQINRITAQLQGLTTIEDVLTTAVETLGQVLEAKQGAIRLVARDIIPAEPDTPTPPRQDDALSDVRKTTETDMPSLDGDL